MCLALQAEDGEEAASAGAREFALFTSHGPRESRFSGARVHRALTRSFLVSNLGLIDASLTLQSEVAKHFSVQPSEPSQWPVGLREPKISICDQNKPLPMLSNKRSRNKRNRRSSRSRKPSAEVMTCGKWVQVLRRWKPPADLENRMQRSKEMPLHCERKKRSSTTESMHHN